MKKLFILRRAFVINRVFVKYGLDELLAPTPLSKYIWLFKIFAISRAKNKNETRGIRLNRALTELGPIFVKLGQMLSTRRDLLDGDLAESLAELQDNVEPFSSKEAIAVVESQLGQSLDALFESFDKQPLASASVAQVHSAQLKSNSDDGANLVDVVVKIIRPGIRKKIDADLKLLKLLAEWFERKSEIGRRIHPVQILKDYQSSLYNELDLQIEAANTAQLKRNFEPSSPTNNASDEAISKKLYVPSIYWELTRESVMVQEKIQGESIYPIGKIETLRELGVNMKNLAHTGVEIFFTQVFRDSYFHADMHPGNIFVDIKDLDNPTYVAIDCGIMGTLNESDKRYLAQNFVAFFNRDYRKIAELHVQSGWVSKDISIEEFESAIRVACEPIFGKSLEEISFGHFLVQLFQTARRFEMEVQPQLVLLQKTLLYIEGLGRQLYPQLDLWETAQPFLKTWLAETYGVKAIFKRLKEKAPHWIQELPEMPDKISALLGANQGQSEQQQNLIDSIDDLKASQAKTGSKVRWAIIGLSLMILAVLPENKAIIDFIWIKEALLGLSVVSFLLSFK
ncbi:MAG: ubiquinone biosynthesis regulatory protein kinase UbiB [Gammaproteobacteria bacterium]|nr:MAG: ubiquinone biosynthesis regulatory protein kinase UbiB [Gammaproteobacteria bacterium]